MNVLSEYLAELACRVSGGARYGRGDVSILTLKDIRKWPKVKRDPAGLCQWLRLLSCEKGQVYGDRLNIEKDGRLDAITLSRMWVFFLKNMAMMCYLKLFIYEF